MKYAKAILLLVVLTSRVALSQNAQQAPAALKEENVALKTEVDALKTSLTKAADAIEAQERAKMIPSIVASTKLTKAEIEAMDTASMVGLLDSFRVLKQPVAGVRPGADEGDASRLTVGSTFKFGPKGGN